MYKGTVYWLTGLSGAGKTTIGKLLYKKLKSEKDNVIFLDGDILREVFGNDLGYSIEDRRKSAMRNSKICKMLSDQGVHVVCATISMFDDCRNWNRENIEKYKEVYIKVPINVLIQRNQKGLYTKALNGEAQQVMGINLEFDEPKEPDVVIVNDGSVQLLDILNIIIE